MNTARTLGAVIQARRLELGWTQEELAERVRAEGEAMRQADVSRLERGGVTLPRRGRLERIAVVLGIPLGELLVRSGWTAADCALANHRDEPELSAAASPPPLPDTAVRHDSPAAAAQTALQRHYAALDHARDLREQSAALLRESAHLGEAVRHGPRRPAKLDPGAEDEPLDQPAAPSKEPPTGAAM